MWPGGGDVTSKLSPGAGELLVFADLDELIAAGWGDTSQHLIPADWRTRRGPDASFSRERKRNIGGGVGRKRWGWKPIRAKQPKRRG